MSNTTTRTTVTDRQEREDSNSFMVAGIIVAFVLLLIGLLIYLYATNQATDNALDSINGNNTTQQEETNNNPGLIVSTPVSYLDL